VLREGKEESPNSLVSRARFLPFAPLARKSPEACHSRESGNPARCGLTWTPAYAGVTTPAIFISLGGPQAHGRSRVNSAKHLSSSSPPAELKKNCRDPSPAQKQGELRMTYDINLRIRNESGSGKA